jgi:predicted ArsR family transcriptional regulator
MSAGRGREVRGIDRVYAALSRTQRKTARQLANETGLSIHVVKNHLYDLKKSGRAVRQPGRNGFLRGS